MLPSSTSHTSSPSLIDPKYQKQQVMYQRSPRACLQCRKQKVRCDVSRHNPPYSNCRTDEIDCLVKDIRSRQSPLSTPRSFSPSGRASKHSSATTSDSESLHIPPGLFDPDAVDWSQIQTFAESVFHSPATLGPDLPSYIRNVPQGMPPEDIAYLRRKGALLLPAPLLRDVLVRTYVDSVHPYMPVVDVEDLLASLETNDAHRGQVSLLLLNTIMLAASAFVDTRVLHEAGFASSIDAQRYFYCRSRLLYEREYESDRIVLVQALLLMTYWYEAQDDQKDPWYWMGITVSVAQTIGLHQNPGHRVLQPKQHRLRKRIWWSCHIRDRLVALSMGRPCWINSTEFNVPMLTIEDFDFVLVEKQGDHSKARDCRMAQSFKQQEQAAMLCIQTAKLSLIISQVLAKALVLNQRLDTQITMLPREVINPRFNTDVCDEELRNWGKELAMLQVHQKITQTLQHGENVCMQVHHAVLKMLYHATVSTLHRSRAFVSPLAITSARNGPGLNFAIQLQRVSRKILWIASKQITDIAYEIDCAKLVSRLPITVITVLLPAVLVHLVNLKTEGSGLRQNNLQGFTRGISIIKKLRHRFLVADAALKLVRTAAGNLGIRDEVYNASQNQYDLEQRVDDDISSSEGSTPHLFRKHACCHLPEGSSCSGHYSSPVGDSHHTALPESGGKSFSEPHFGPGVDNINSIAEDHGYSDGDGCRERDFYLEFLNLDSLVDPDFENRPDIKEEIAET